MRTMPDVEVTAKNLNEEYRSNVMVLGDTPIPGLSKPGKEEQFDKFRELVDATVEYFVLAVPGFKAAKFYQQVYS